MTATGPTRRDSGSVGQGWRWIPVLVAVLALPLVVSLGAGTATAADTEAPEWGNVTRGNATTIDVTVYDNSSLQTGSVSKDDFSITAGRIKNVTVSSLNTSTANRTGMRVSIRLVEKLDVDNVTVSLDDDADIRDEAGNELPDREVTVTGMDSVVPKYRSFTLRRVNDSTAEIVVETHEPLDELRVSVGGESVDSLNISAFTEHSRRPAIYSSRYTFPEEGEYSLLLMRVVDENGNENRFGRQRTFHYDGTEPNVTLTGPSSATLGDRLNFSVNATDENGIDSYRWRIDRGTILSGDRITVAFGTPGTHEVTAEVTDSMGNTATTTRFVSVTGEVAPGTVSVRRRNASAVTVSANGTGTTQRVRATDGALVTSRNVTLERFDATFPAEGSVSLEVRARNRTPPSFASATGGTGLGRLDVDHDGTAGEDVTFVFAVDRTALERANATAADVTLYRGADGWTPLETVVATRSRSRLVYRASSPGLSTFVVGTAATDETASRTIATAESVDSSDNTTSDPATGNASSVQSDSEEPTAEATGQPDIVLANATATPATLSPGDRTVIRVALANRGSATGDHRLLVVLNRTVLTERTVTVPAGETRTTEVVQTVPAESTGGLSVDGRRVANVTADSGGGGGLSVPVLPSLSLPNPLALWPDGIVGTILGGLVGFVVALYGVLKALAIYLGY